MKKVFDIVHRAQAAALATARPGAECGAVDAAARKVIVDSGYGPDYKYFAHRLGHGMAWMATSGLIWFAATPPNSRPT